MGMGSQTVRKLVSLAAFVLMGVGLVAVPSPAHAATTEWYFSANTGATYVKALGGAVSSDLTAASGISGGPDTTSKNSTLSANVANLLSAGAAETRTTATRNSARDLTLNSYARVAGVNLLNGLIKIDAVETDINTIAKADGTHTVNGGTKFLGIKIAGVNLPATIPLNYGVSIPGVAAISLNNVTHASKDGLTATLGWGLAVQLLGEYGGYDVGTTIVLNPVNHYLTEVIPASDGPRLGGFAYATKVQANVTNQVKVISDPTAIVYTPYGGSQGKELTNSTASVNLPGLLTVGAIKSTSTSSKDNATGNAEIRNSNATAKVNVLNGLIKADAIEVIATGKRTNGVWSHTEQMNLVNLVIAGNAIPINVSPNTVINVAGLGKVEINVRSALPSSMINGIVGLRITLDTAKAGLPAGAVVELAFAATQMSLS